MTRPPLRSALLLAGLFAAPALAQLPPTGDPVFGATGTTATAKAAPAPPPVRPVGDAATVNGKPIPEAAVQRALRSVPTAEHAKARPEVIQYLVDNALVEQYLVSQNVAVDAKAVDAQVEEFRKEIKAGNGIFERALANLMLTEPELRGLIEAQLRWEQFVEGQSADAKLEAFFNANLATFDGRTVRARHILLDEKTPTADAVAQLQAIKQAIEAGAAAANAQLPADTPEAAREAARCKKVDELFAAQAREKSACPSKRNGGDLNWFPRSGSMVEPFAKAAFAQKPFVLAEPVSTNSGTHLILVIDTKPGQEVKFADVKAEVREYYGSKLKEMMVPQLRTRGKVEILAAPAK